jgi:hypothetical protein
MQRTRTSPHHLARMPQTLTFSTTRPCSSHWAVAQPVGTDDRRALRLYCSTMRDAVDAQAGCVEQGQGESSPCVLCPATCARLHGVHTATLRSMDCLRRMLQVGPAGAVFPRLQSLRLHLVGHEANAHSPCVHAMHALLICRACLI